MNLVDLFAGVGGLSYGFMEEGFDIVLANEVDKSIANSYIENHKKTKMINQDTTKIDLSSVFGSLKNNIDVVVGGPPCQGFSQKGKRDFVNDKRNFLFKYYFEVVKYIKPKVFVMENVPNILTSNNGSFKQEIFNLFEEIGYKVSAKVLNAYDFGVPQKRKRAIIIGSLKEKIEFEFNNSEIEKTNVKDAISDLYFLNNGEGKEIQSYLFEPLTDFQKLMREGMEELHNHVATKHSNEALEKMKLIPIGMGKEVLPKEMLTKSVFSGTWSRMIEEEPSVTITTRFDTPSSGRFIHPVLNRAITVREAARLQSFPDNFIFYGSKSSQMKQVGNAVPPLLSQAIAKKIKDNLK